MQKPKIKKIIVNMGIGEGAHDKKLVENASSDLTIITGQKPKICPAKSSIAEFKIRRGDPIGVMVTLRGKRMEAFLKKLIMIVLPRLRDFQGVSPTAFDGNGNYNLGITEQIVFPEIDYSKIDNVRGLQITIVTDTNSDDLARELLRSLGMPFAKQEAEKGE